jgi:hypothetical protein
MPPRPNEIPKVLRAWPGSRFVIVTRSEFPFSIAEHNPAATAYESEAIQEGGWVQEWERDLLSVGTTRVLIALRSRLVS